MSALAMKPPPIALALLAVAAVYYLTRRNTNTRAGAGSGGQPFGQYGAAPLQSYFRPRAGTTPLVSAPGQQSGSLASQGLGVVQSLLDLVARGGSEPKALSPTVTYDAGPLYRATDYVPGYTPDTSGEAAAQEYFYKNPDEFIGNVPTNYAYNNGHIGGTGEFLDNQ